MLDNEDAPQDHMNAEVFPSKTVDGPLSEDLARQRIAERVARSVQSPPPIDALPGGPVPVWRRLPVLLGAAALGLLLCVVAAAIVLRAADASTALTAAPIAMAGEKAAAPRALAGSAPTAGQAPGQTPAAPGGPLGGAPVAATPTQDDAALDGDFLLFYDANTFYIYNQSGQDYPVNNMAFELVNGQGDPLTRVEGRYWSRFYGRFKDGTCLEINRFEVKTPFVPRQCHNNVLVYRSPTDEQNMFFWVAQPDAREFRVLWQGQEIARCPVDAGPCGVNLP